jgi:hypothetical protein
MPTSIQPYLPEHEKAVQEFNARLQAGGAEKDLVFYPTSVPRWLPPAQGCPVYNKYFVALEGGSVRGAYALKHEEVFVRGKGSHSIACYHHPLSEGILRRTYAPVAGMMLRDALARAPKLYALGMGGSDRPLAKMLRASGWTLLPVPFYFRVVRPSLFLREMEALRGPSWRSLLMDLAAVTGIGWAGIHALQAVRQLGAPRREFVVERMDDFGDWADPLWNAAKETCTLSRIRDCAMLRTLYPAGHSHLTRLRVSRQGAPVGWAVIGERRADARFGSMRVGSIIDCWALRDECVPVVSVATKALEEQGMDLVVSNQSHRVWGHAFQSAGFLSGISNFIFAASKKLVELLHPFEENKSSLHLTRSDGDGLPRNF